MAWLLENGARSLDSSLVDVDTGGMGGGTAGVTVSSSPLAPSTTHTTKAVRASVGIGRWWQLTLPLALLVFLASARLTLPEEGGAAHG